MKSFPFTTLVIVIAVSSAHTAAAAFYRAGDIVQNFTLTDRATRQPVELSDLEGKIVFLEWFAWWCPFCQASAPEVAAGIDRWYEERAGNPAGIPVMHVAVNLQSGQEVQTHNFVTRAGFRSVLEDFNRAVANRFQSGGQPIFAIINGVTNSPSHRPWELLLHQDGYGQRDFSESIQDFRAVIDTVQKPPLPPVLGALGTDGDGGWTVTIQGQAGVRYAVESSPDLQEWSVVTNVPAGTVIVPAAGPALFIRARAE